jgi:hypothetical protein
MPTLHDHALQILRVGDDLQAIDTESNDFGKSHIVHSLLLIAETILFFGAAAEALHGGLLPIILALGGLVMVSAHVWMKKLEQGRHERHKSRVRQRREELRQKAEELLREAEQGKLNTKPQWPWWRWW